MKRFYFFVVFFIVFFSCSKTELLVFDSSVSKGSNDSSVSIHDILTIVSADSPSAKSTTETEIVPYIKNNRDTLLYIVNTANKHGWKIYSSDKRTPAVLAEGDNGYFSIQDGSPAVAAWIDCMASDIARVRHSPDKDLIWTQEEIENHKGFWTRERFHFHDSLSIPIIPGHWEETHYSTTVEYDHIDHLTAHWDQYEPYSNCCPYLVNQPTRRAVAGCVAVAGSQVLHYLHGKIGIPETMYSQGFCIGDIDGFYREFSNPSDSVWNAMNTEYYGYSTTVLPESILIGYVGHQVGMHYCEIGSNYFSWALPGNLQSDLFEYHGINCSRGDYNGTVVASSLLSQMPVIVSASNLLIPVDFDIHCFVIDGYQRTRTMYVTYHYFVYDEIPEGLIHYPPPPEYCTYTYSSPSLTRIKINWGWWTQWQEENPVNDGWYTLTDGWTVTNGGNTYDYNYNRTMTYGFIAQ